MKRLDEIRLYTRSEYDSDPQNARPVKTVHFSYDYSLCPGIDNSEGETGKLTLTKVYTTYNGTMRGKLNSYKFKYDGANKSYARGTYDKWGGYKDSSPYGNPHYDFHEHPYVEQTGSGESADNWHLTKIILPTGGELELEYENDDYAYVQDRRAMMMMDIVALRNDDDGAPGILGEQSVTNRFSGNAVSETKADLKGRHDGYRIYFSLKDNVPDNEGNDADFERRYLGDMDRIYFRAKVDLPSPNNNCPGDIDGDGEYIPGFARIQRSAGSFGYAKLNQTSQGFDLGFVTLEPEKAGQFDAHRIHPFRKAALSHLRTERPELMFGDPCPEAFQMSDIFGVIGDATQLATGYENYAIMQKKAKYLHLDGNSIIRLYEPDRSKRGGGNRIRSVRMNDKWTDISARKKIDGGQEVPGFYDGVYGQIYEYTAVEDGGVISSGVAHESLNVGKDEHPLYDMEGYEENWTPTGRRKPFVEKPLMSNYYPAPTVGYSKVMVRSITSENENTDRATTPVNIYEFHTPKDFPVKVERTRLKRTEGPYEINKFRPFPFNYTDMEKDFFASQGYTVVLNDMAGKPKYVGQAVLQGDDPTDVANGAKPRPLSSIPMGTSVDGDNLVLISIKGTKYNYKTDAEGNLDNMVDVVTSDMRVEKNVEMGVEYDIMLEMMEDRTESTNRVMDMNLEGIFGPIPFLGNIYLPLPIPYQSARHVNKTSIRQSVLQKVVNRSGILHSVEVSNETSTITTENVYYDGLTGEALLTRTENEFHDDIYSYGQKAHWFERGMSTAYENRGLVYDCVSGDCNDTGVGEYFEIGDKVWIEPQTGDGFRGHVYGVTDNGIGLMDWDGVPVDNGISRITVIESGKRNLLGATAGSVTAMVLTETPISGNEFEFEFDEILDASAMKYRDVWHEPDLSCVADVESTDCNADLGCGYLEIQTDMAHYGIRSDGTKVKISESDYFGDPFLPSGNGGFLDFPNDYNYTEFDLAVNIRITSGMPSGVTVSSVSYDHYQPSCEGSCTGEYGTNCCDGGTSAPCYYSNLSTLCSGLPQPMGSGIWDGTANFQGNENGTDMEISLAEGVHDSPQLCSNCYYLYASGFVEITLSNGCVYYGDIRDSGLHRGTDVLIGTCGAKTICEDCVGVEDCAVIEVGIAPGHDMNTIRVLDPKDGTGGTIPHDLLTDGNDGNTGTSITTYKPEVTISIDGSTEGCMVESISIESPAIDNWGDGGCGFPSSLDPTTVTGNTYGFDLSAYCSSSSNPDTYLLGGELVVVTDDGCIYKMELNLSEGGTFVIRPSACGNPLASNDYDNIFARGVKGLWRPWVSYNYMGERDYSSEKLREKGHYKSYTPFMHGNHTGQDPAWKRTNMVTKYSNRGHELENKNALDQYSSALYEYDGMLATAVASNARYQEIAFEGFEDYPLGGSECRHLDFDYDNLAIERDVRSHTGEKSLRIGTGGSATATVLLEYFDEETCSYEWNKPAVSEYLSEGLSTDYGTLPNYLRNSRDIIEYPDIPRKCVETGLFSPYPGKKYVISAWVSGEQRHLIGTPPTQSTDLPFAGIKVAFIKNNAGGNTSAYTALPVFRPSGPVIEGWQRIIGEFTLPELDVKGGWDRMSISLFTDSATPGHPGVLFDDLRIHPYDGNMKGFVYDVGSMRTTAELDANNFATYYIYDNEGNLSKVKKETEEGVKTLQEGTMHTKPSH